MNGDLWTRQRDLEGGRLACFSICSGGFSFTNLCGTIRVVVSVRQIVWLRAKTSSEERSHAPFVVPGDNRSSNGHFEEDTNPRPIRSSVLDGEFDSEP